EVDALGPVIDARMSAHGAAVAQYNDDVASFNDRAQGGGFDSREQFDRERAALVTRGAGLDAEAAALHDQVAHYNGLIAQLTALDADYAELYSALDATADPDAVDP